MPAVSEKQRRYMWANHPEIAERWAHEGRSKKRKSKRSKRQNRRR